MLDADVVGTKVFFSVSEFNTVFGGAFEATSDGSGEMLAYALDVNGDMSAGELTTAGEVDYYCFTVDNADTGMPGCNAADLAMPFDELDIADVVTFLQLFGAMDPAADLAPPMGDFDIADVVTFLQVFGAGCPE